MELTEILVFKIHQMDHHYGPPCIVVQYIIIIVTENKNKNPIVDTSKDVIGHPLKNHQHQMQQHTHGTNYYQLMNFGKCWFVTATSKVVLGATQSDKVICEKRD